MRIPYRSTITVRDLPGIVSDEPISNGGTNAGPTPLELVLAGLVAGINVATARAAREMDFEFERLVVEAKGILPPRENSEFDPRPRFYTKIVISVDVATLEPKHRIQQLGKMVGEKGAVLNMIGAAVHIDMKWRAAEPSAQCWPKPG